MIKPNPSAAERIVMGIVWIVLGLLVIACLFPFWHLLVVSISNGTEVIQGNVTFWPKGFSLSSYKTLLSDPFVPSAYQNTLLYVALGIVINIFLTTLCAWPLSRPDLPFKKFFMGMIVFTMIFSGGMIPTYLLVAKTLGLKGSFWAVLLVNGISTYNMIVMRTFFMTTIPLSLLEAARIDGADDFRMMFTIVLPLAKPIMATMVLFYAVAQWNRFFDYMLYLNSKNDYPLQLLLRAMVIEGNLGSSANQNNVASDVFASETGIKYAAIIVTIAPILAAYPFLQKYLVKGQMVGSMKG